MREKSSWKDPLESSAQSNMFNNGPSFSLVNKVYRLLFIVVWFLLARWTPPPMFRFRVLLLRLFGAKIDWTARVYASVKIWSPINLEVGEGTVIGPGVTIYNQGKLFIGRYAVLSQMSYVCTGTHDIDEPTFQLKTLPITICDFAWLAAGCFLLPGVVVGRGAVVGARSVVGKNVDELNVVAGNPAKFLKMRSASSICDVFE